MGLVSVWWTELMLSKPPKILFMLSHIFFVCLFFPEFLISSIHNQYPVNEMISADDTGCHKDKDTLFGSCRTENAE